MRTGTVCIIREDSEDYKVSDIQEAELMFLTDGEADCAAAVVHGGIVGGSTGVRLTSLSQ